MKKINKSIKMVENDIHIDFAKLESKVETMNEKLNRLDNIEATLKDITKLLNNHNTEVALLKQDVDNVKGKVKDIDERLIKVEKNQTWILAKVSAFATIITGIVSWISYSLFGK